MCVSFYLRRCEAFPSPRLFLRVEKDVEFISDIEDDDAIALRKICAPKYVVSMGFIADCVFHHIYLVSPGASSFYVYIGVYGWAGNHPSFQVVATTGSFVVISYQFICSAQQLFLIVNTFIARPLSELGPQTLSSTLSSIFSSFLVNECSSLLTLPCRRRGGAHLRTRNEGRTLPMPLRAVGRLYSLWREPLWCTSVFEGGISNSFLILNTIPVSVLLRVLAGAFFNRHQDDERVLA